MHIILMMVFAMQSLGTASGEPHRGNLCLRDSGSVMVARRCPSVEGRSFEVETGPEERVFGWISADRSTIALGVVPASADNVKLPEGPAAINLEIKGSEDRDWPQATTLTIGTRETPGRWQIELSAVDVVRLRTILVPLGTWDIRLKASRHAVTAFPRTRVLEAVNVGVITLEPLPRIRGTVIDREGKFLTAAVMIGHEGDVLATSDNFGEILYEAPCTQEGNCILPESFRIEYPGTAQAWFTITNRRRDLDLDTVRLAKGGTLHVELDRGSVKTPLVVEILDDPTAQIPALRSPRRTISEANERWHRLQLRRDAPDLFVAQQYFPRIDSASLTDDASSVKFENLPEGQLRLVVRGRDQGEYLSRFFNVAPEQTLEIEVAIQPTEVTVEVSRDGKDIEGVPVQITQWDAPWHRVQTAPTDAKGKSTITIWEKRRHTAHLADANIRAATEVEIGEEKTQTVAIGGPWASIAGQVVDASTGKPVAGAALLFEDLFYYGDSAPRAVTDNDGRFKIESVVPGNYHYQLRAEGFLPIEGGGRTEPGHNDLPTIRVSPGAEYRVSVVWEDGKPIPGAVYLENSGLYGRHVADENGEITFRRGIPERPVPFWIVPAQGSFARGERGFDQKITIRVQQPGEKLILDFEDAEEEPVNFAHANFGWDGHQIPREVRLAIESIQNKSFRSGASSRLTLAGLPPGRYTFSAIRSFGLTPWFPEWEWRPLTTVHYSGMEQVAKIVMPVPRTKAE
ncbi:MAG: carboxypeptidase regulatory-like domain-containing protein [Thermoanaerobaculia bacterium]